MGIKISESNQSDGNILLIITAIIILSIIGANYPLGYIGTIVYVILFIALVYSIFQKYITIHTSFVTLQNESQGKLSDIRVIIANRIDMIEKLYHIVNQHAQLESGTAIKIAEINSLRSLIGTASPKEIVPIERSSAQIYGTIIGGAEKDPTIRSSDQYKVLINTIAQLETEITQKRLDYNRLVTDHNTLLDRIPSKFVGTFCGFSKIEHLQYKDLQNNSFSVIESTA